MDSSDSQPPPLPVTRRRRQADEWALVLAAEGFEATVARCSQGYRIELAQQDTAAAGEILEAWLVERAERARSLEPPPSRSATVLEVAVAYALTLSLLAFYLGLNASDQSKLFYDAGANRADLVANGEFWRLVTSLTLHSGISHVLGNTFFGGFFLAYVSGRLGIGFGVLAFIITGTFGNLANDLYYGFDHLSIGASTGVFGLVGVLSGLAAWRRHQMATPGRGAWVSFGAGLGIVAMLGSGGPQIDVSAHLFGMLVGGLVGLMIAIALATRPPPGRSAQAAALVLSALVIVGAWSAALAE